MIANPASGNAIMPNIFWCADNAVFGGKYPGDGAYLGWLADRAEHAGRCAFATAPDVVGDSAATLERSLPMLPKIRGAGYHVAFVAQDGLRERDVPWDEFDALFIGGSTEWKLGVDAARFVAQANERGKWTHMGRVNSERRLRYAYSIGCASVDGTFLAFGPKVNLLRLLGWLSRL